MKTETLGLDGGQKSKAPLSTRDVEAAINFLKEKDSMYGRIAADAIKILNQKDITSEIKMRALAFMQTDAFHDRVKEFWKDATLRGVRNPDDEKQEKDWAVGLAKRVLDELPTQESL